MLHHPHDPTHTPPRTKIVVLLLCVSSPATEIPSSTMTKSLIKFVQIIYIISSILKAFFFLHPLSCEATLFFFVPFLLPFALFGLNVWDQLDYVNTVFANRPNVNSRPQDSRHWMSTWMSLCFGGVYYSHRSTLGTTASWGSMDAPGCCWDAPGWSWLLLVGPPPCFSISPEVAPVCPGAVQSRRGGPCIK